jgi:hypothetical protein
MVFWLEIRTGVRIFFDYTPQNLVLLHVLAYPVSFGKPVGAFHLFFWFAKYGLQKGVAVPTR